MCCSFSVHTVEVDQPSVVDKLDRIPILLETRRLNLIALFMKLLVTFTAMPDKYALLGKNSNALKVVMDFSLVLYEILDNYGAIRKEKQYVSVEELDEAQLEGLFLTSFFPCMHYSGTAMNRGKLVKASS